MKYFGKSIWLQVFTLLCVNHLCAQAYNSSESIEFLECYDRNSLKDSWGKVVSYLSSEDRANPVDVNTMIDATGDFPFAYVKQNSKASLDSILHLPEICAFFPPHVRFVWSTKTTERFEAGVVYSLYATKTSANGSGCLTDEHLKKAVAGYSRINQVHTITLHMTAEGTKRWKAITERNIGRVILILVNGQILSEPRVYQAISDSKTEISGIFSKEEAEAFARFINQHLHTKK
jgi:preprotein translocase subunit SecD